MLSAIGLASLGTLGS